MARKKPPPVDSLTLRYDLHDLPTAQHRAGLAGLLLQVDSMAERKAAGALSADLELPVVEHTATSATVQLTAPALQGLLDDLYAARTVERSAKSWASNNKEPPKRVEVVSVTDARGKAKEEKRYVYEVIEPANLFLHRYTEGAKEPWHKLWRDMLWAIPRGPKTRGPFEDRAAGRPAGLAAEIWKGLVAHYAAAQRCEVHVVDLVGADLLGAQAANAERVPFQDRADQALLLAFWPLTVRVFLSEEIDAEGKASLVRDSRGSRMADIFVIAIPDPVNLDRFARAYRLWLSELPTAMGDRGRPAEAIVSLPAEGPLEFLHQLARLVERRVLQEPPARYLSGVEFFAMSRPGNTTRTLAHGRIPASDRLLLAYDGIRAAYRNPFVRSNLLLAILHDWPWFDPFADPIRTRRWWHFLHSQGRSKHEAIGIAWEINRRFRIVINTYRLLMENNMPDAATRPDAVDRLVYGLVGTYVKQWACQRAGVKPTDENWWTRTAAERQEICAKVFLELRSRHDDDFVRQFTARFGSVPQWLDANSYAAVAAALMRTHTAEPGEDRPRTRDDVRTLTLLALAAHSRSLKGPDELNQSSKPESTLETDA
jgi:CRISPR-associated protein Cmx8